MSYESVFTNIYVYRKIRLHCFKKCNQILFVFFFPSSTLETGGQPSADGQKSDGSFCKIFLENGSTLQKSRWVALAVINWNVLPKIALGMAWMKPFHAVLFNLLSVPFWCVAYWERGCSEQNSYNWL